MMSRIKGRIAAAESKAGIRRQDNRIDLFFVEGWLPCIARHGDASRCDDGNVRDHRSAPALFSQDRGAELWCRRTWRARQPCGQFLRPRPQAASRWPTWSEVARLWAYRMGSP